MNSLVLVHYVGNMCDDVHEAARVGESGCGRDILDLQELAASDERALIVRPLFATPLMDAVTENSSAVPVEGVMVTAIPPGSGELCPEASVMEG